MALTHTLTGVALLGLTAALLPASSGHATMPGSSGKIAFAAVMSGSFEVLVTDGSTTTQLTSHSGKDIDPAWSPDGSKIAWASDQPDAGGSEGHTNIWVMDADGTDMVNLTDGPVTSLSANAGVEPTWSPAGNWIAYSYQGDVWVMPSAGGPETNLMPGTGAENAGIHPSFSPDGRIAFVRNGDIWVMDTDGQNAKPLTATVHPAAEKYPDWSPDGTRIVYEREGEIWRMNADGSGQVRVSGGADKGGTRPEWSPEGDRIVFSSSGYTAPNGPDVFTARPDGTQVLRKLASTGFGDHSPAWQPLAGGTPWGTYTTAATQLKKHTIVASGEVFPANSGGTVKVILQRKTQDGFRKVAGDVAVLSEYGRYGMAFARPDARTCRVVATFLGDAESAPSRAVKTFDC